MVTRPFFFLNNFLSSFLVRELNFFGSDGSSSEEEGNATNSRRASEK